jgi:hypothetical protein
MSRSVTPFSALPLLFASQASTVTIELPKGTPTALVQQVVDSCNQALGSPRCHPALDPGGDTALYALVLWDGNELTISLRRKAPNGVEIDSRHVAFSDADDPRDRYIAAGLMVAALTAAQPNEPTPAPTPAPAPETPKAPLATPASAPATVPAEQSSAPLHLGLYVGAEAGQGLTGQSPKWGGGLRLWWLAHEPRLGVTASASLLGAKDSVSLRWTTLCLGFTARLTPWESLFGVDVVTDATAQHTRASATLGAETDSAELWRFGGRFGALVSLDTGSWVQPYVGVSLTLLERGVEVTLEQEAQGSESLLTLGGSLGIRLAPF